MDRFLNRSTLQLIALIVVGFILLVISKPGIQYIIDTSQISQDNSNFIYPILIALKPITESFSYILMGIGAIVLSIKGIAIAAWKATGEIAITEMQKTLSDNFGKIQQDTEGLANKVKTYIDSLGRPIAIGECNNRQDFKSFSSISARGIYGPHVSNQNSLYSFAESHILDPYCNLPHPSGVKKRIKMSISKHPGFIDWNEHTSYNIHHVTYAITRSDAQFIVKYRTNSFAPNFDLNSWGKIISLKVVIDGETIIKPDEKPRNNECITEDGFYYWSDGDWITVHFQHTIILTKEWTPVEIEENSINSEEDKTYSLNTSRPTCGYEIDLTTPDNYHIIRSPFISPFMLYRDLPEFSKQEIRKKCTDPKQDNLSHINIKMEDWILPGIVATINWTKKDS